jgi:hypothetical protein
MAKGTEARSLMDHARHGAFSKLDSQRERAATGLGSMVDALRESGRQLEGQNATMASYVTGAASQLERFSGGIRDRDVNQIVRDVERFARQRPAIFLGSAFALGIVAARFLKSSGAENGADASGSMPRSSAFATRTSWPDESIGGSIGGERAAAAASGVGTTRTTGSADQGGAPAETPAFRG